MSSKLTRACSGADKPRAWAEAMASVRLLCDWLGRDRRHCGVQPSSKPLLYEFENCAPIFENRFQPGEAAHLGKIDSPEAEACNKDVDAIAQRSEEHTSELQSRFDIVCRLLLEKK